MRIPLGCLPNLVPVIRRSPGTIAILGLMSSLIVTSQLRAAEAPPPPSEEDIKFFETRIRPLLVEKCAGCHGEDVQESDLRLDTYAGIFAGGKSGPTLERGNPDASILIGAINYQDLHLQMPPDEKLPDSEIALLKEWIQRGAPHPDSADSGSILPRKGAIDLTESREFWAFQPIEAPEIPASGPGEWGVNAVDSLLLANLKSKGLTPNPAADKRTLIRRATFDLTGLPPTPAEIDAFLADESPNAYESLIERLLASRQYGERWGRHWLDVVRYADSNGQDENQGFVDAWRYRNYVIDAFNEDKPFDQFIHEQIAGDLMEGGDDYSRLIATGFLALGPKVLAEKDIVKMEMDIIDEQIDVFSQAFLGMTIACARCHDHKFDPIFTADYYALAGIFKSTRSMASFATIAQYSEHTLATPQEIEDQKIFASNRAERKAELDALVASANAEWRTANGLAADAAVPDDVETHYADATKAKLAELRGTIADLDGKIRTLPTAMGVSEGKIENTRIHVRGSHLTLGKEVDRGAPQVMLPEEQTLTISPEESGRLQLAKWLTSPTNPLTARVAVNRVWRWHFGKGIVPSTDNFGRLGEASTNPELLDWLATEFMQNGWSMKHLHRQIMLSSAYQMSSDENEANSAIDIENKYHWRANVQRLDAQEIRDSLLAVSGKLSLEPAESVLSVPKWTLVFDHTSLDNTTYDPVKRSVYLPVIRNNLYDGFSLFDYTNADVTTGSRETSTVAPQALYMMNSENLLTVSDDLVQRLENAHPDSEAARVVMLYELAYGRLPAEFETNRVLQYVNSLEKVMQSSEKFENPRKSAWSAACQSILASNEFIYVD